MGRRVSTPEGAQIVQVGALPASRWTYAAASGGITNSAAAVTVQAAPGAALKHYIRWVSVVAGTLGAALELVIQDGDGTVYWRVGFATTGGIINHTFDIPLALPLNKSAQIKLSSAQTGNVYVNVGGYTAA